MRPGNTLKVATKQLFFIRPFINASLVYKLFIVIFVKSHCGPNWEVTFFQAWKQPARQKLYSRVKPLCCNMQTRIVFYLTFVDTAIATCVTNLRCMTSPDEHCNVPGISFVNLRMQTLINWPTLPWKGHTNWINCIYRCMCIIMPFQKDRETIIGNKILANFNWYELHFKGIKKNMFLKCSEHKIVHKVQTWSTVIGCNDQEVHFRPINFFQQLTQLRIFSLIPSNNHALFFQFKKFYYQ